MDKAQISELLKQAKDMPYMTIYGQKNCICIGPNMLGLFIKDSSGRWDLATEVPHNMQCPHGVLLPINWNVYLWTSDKCYELDLHRGLPVDFCFYKDKEHLTSNNAYDIARWQWNEVRPEKVLGAYLCATGRDPLKTKVADRETRAEQREDALHELRTGSWVKKLPIGNIWTKEQDVYKYQSQLDAIRRQEEKAVEKARQEAELERKRQDLSHKKSHIVAGLLAIFLGTIGAHKFYMGKKMTGFIYLVLCLTWLPTIIGFIEGVKYLIEGQDKFVNRLL